MTCSPSEPPPIPVARTPRPPASSPALPKTSAPTWRSGLPRLPYPQTNGAKRSISGWVQQFAATPTAARWARRHTADVLDQWGLPEMADDCCLVVSELIGNVVRHSVSGDNPAVCRLVLRQFSDAVSVEVWDSSPDADVRCHEAELLSESGRGLAIVTALCGTPPLVFVIPGAGKAVVAVIPRGTS